LHGSEVEQRAAPARCLIPLYHSRKSRDQAWLACMQPEKEEPMYIAGFVIPVPEEKMEAYRKWAENGAALFREYGCLEIVESWEDNVPTGKYTDFRRAVDAKAGEKIVFSWQVWPDKATLESAEARMHEDKRFEVTGEIPFDPKRLILRCFKPIHTMGRK
jgi:uncharacterized protein YbaA (DUF1428 family)